MGQSEEVVRMTIYMPNVIWLKDKACAFLDLHYVSGKEIP